MEGKTLKPPRLDPTAAVFEAMHLQAKCMWTLARAIGYHAEIVSGHYKNRCVAEMQSPFTPPRVKLEAAFADLRNICGVMRDYAEDIKKLGGERR